MAHPDLSLLLLYPMKNSASHGQVKDTIRKKPAKQAEMTRCFKLHLQNSMFFLFGSPTVSDGSEMLLWLPRKIYDRKRTDFTWQRVHARFAVFYGRPNCSLFCRC